jgi:hypothetical protein
MISLKQIESSLRALEQVHEEAAKRKLTLQPAEAALLVLAAAVHELDDTLQQALPGAGRGY